MKRSVRLRLTDMLDAIEGIEATVGEATFAEELADAARGGARLNPAPLSAI